MGVAVLHHHRVSFDPSCFATPPPKPSRSATKRAERSSPPSAPRSAPKVTTTATLSPAKPANQARPSRRARVLAEDSPHPRRCAGVGGGMVEKLSGRNLVMGEVTILKRGEDPKAAAVSATPPVLSVVPQATPAPVPVPMPALKQPSPPPPAPDRSSEAAASKADDVVFSSTERLGPEPEVLPKQIRLAQHTKPPQGLSHKSAVVYAGAGFIASPSPSCLPFPTSLFAKKDLVDKAEAATKSLKYLLRLDLA